jgi:hypothetical protein
VRVVGLCVRVVVVRGGGAQALVELQSMYAGIDVLGTRLSWQTKYRKW